MSDTMPNGLAAPGSDEDTAAAPDVAAGKPQEIIARFDRGPNEHLQVVLSEYLGHPFIALQHWRLQPGHRRPAMVKQFTVKVREASALAQLLTTLAARFPDVQQRVPITPHRE